MISSRNTAAQQAEPKIDETVIFSEIQAESIEGSPAQNQCDCNCPDGDCCTDY